MGLFSQKAIKKVLRHIEENLTEELTLAQLSKIAGISKYHFHRIFSSYMEQSIGQYIKSRRIEKSMKQLAHTKSKTIDVALDAGYGSHSYFTKSFTKETGLSPKEFRNNVGDKHLSSHMKHTEIPFLGYEEVKPQKIIYVRKTGNYQISASQAWDALARTLEANGFFSTDGEYFGISHDDPHAEDIQEEALRFDACAVMGDESDRKKLLKDGLLETELPGGFFAKFLHRGAFERLGESFHYIYGSWIYLEDQKLRDANPMIKMPYVFDRSRKAQEQEAIIYIPIKRPD